MHKQPVPQRRILDPRHGNLQHSHDLPAIDAQHGRTHDQLRLGIDERFDEATQIVHLERARDITHQHVRDAHFLVLRCGRRFCEPDAPQLRVGEGSVKHQVVASGSGAKIDGVWF